MWLYIVGLKLNWREWQRNQTHSLSALILSLKRLLSCGDESMVSDRARTHKVDDAIFLFSLFTLCVCRTWVQEVNVIKFLIRYVDDEKNTLNICVDHLVNGIVCHTAHSTHSSSINISHCSSPISKKNPILNISITILEKKRRNDDENKKKSNQRKIPENQTSSNVHISKTFVIFNIQLLLKSNKLLSNIEHDE